MTPRLLLPHEDPSDPAHMALVEKQVGKVKKQETFCLEIFGQTENVIIKYTIQILNSKILKIMKDKHSVEQVEVESLYSIVQISNDQ